MSQLAKHQKLKSLPDKLWVRVTVSLLIAAATAFGAWYLYRYGNPVPCLMYLATGLFCPGCGSGRAARALLHLDFASAADYNVLFVAVLPFAAYYLLKLYVRFVSGRDVLPFFKLGSKTGWTLLAVLIGYTVARNLPFDPFIRLAP